MPQLVYTTLPDSSHKSWRTTKLKISIVHTFNNVFVSLKIYTYSTFFAVFIFQWIVKTRLCLNQTEFMLIVVFRDHMVHCFPILTATSGELEHDYMELYCGLLISKSGR